MKKPSAKFEYKTFALGEKLTEEQKEYFKKYGVIQFKKFIEPETAADIAIIVGGYNSSNTTHLVELCEEKLPTYFINSVDKIISATEILHFNFHDKKEYLTRDFLPAISPAKILISSGASCPDSLVEAVIERLASLYKSDQAFMELKETYQ